MKFQPIANSLRSAQWQDHVGASVSGLRAWRQSGFRPSTIPAALPESRIQLEETTALLPPFLILLSLFSRFFCTSKACRGLTASRARGVQWAHCTSCLCKRNTYERYLTGGKRSSYQKYPSPIAASTSWVDFSIPPFFAFSLSQFRSMPSRNLQNGGHTYLQNRSNLAICSSDRRGGVCPDLDFGIIPPIEEVAKADFG